MTPRPHRLLLALLALASTGGLTACGTRTYWNSRITCGHTKDLSAERSGRSRLSMISALPFHTRTCARRSEHTFSGS